MKPFTVTYRKMRVRVVVLKDGAAVHKKCEQMAAQKLVTNEIVAGAFFMQNARKSNYVGTVYFPKRGGELLNYVPHEVTHAVMHKLITVRRDKDERLAYAIGELSAKIFRKFRSEGIRLC